MSSSTLTLAIAQIAPVWLDRDRTLAKIADYITRAAQQGAEVVVFGEALVPGYPYWLSLTDGATFESSIQKDWHAHYLQQSVSIEDGNLQTIQDLAAQHQIAIYLGIIERPADRGGHSCYCSLVFIDAQGTIGSVHRKLMPTYEERLVWATGDGHGLTTHSIGPFTAGGLSCWENWMPLPRAALYAQSENLHIATWPGCVRNTIDITRFIAKEARSYVVSACGLLRQSDIPDTIPHYATFVQLYADAIGNGGSAIAGPDGQWVVEPVADQETLIVQELDLQQVLRERQNFDPSGHYARPDVLRLELNDERQSVLQRKG